MDEQELGAPRSHYTSRNQDSLDACTVEDQIANNDLYNFSPYSERRESSFDMLCSKLYDAHE